MMQFGSIKFQPSRARLTALILCLGFLGQSTLALAGPKKTGFKPKRGIGRSSQRIGLASRGGCSVTEDSKPLTTLVPKSIGVTAEALPVLPWFMPEHTYPSVEVRLLGESEFGMEIIHRQVFESLPKNQVVSYDLASAGVAPLEAGKLYKWQVHLVCNPDMPSGNRFADGWIEYEPASTELTSQLASRSAEEKANLWLENGYWYDGIQSFISMPAASGTSSADWQALMTNEHVELDHLASLPMSSEAETIPDESAPTTDAME